MVSYIGFAPGRTTLNDHVDYWHGIGVGAALKKGITVTYTPSDDATASLIMQSKGKGVATKKIEDAAYPPGHAQDWSNYVAGAFNYLQKFGSTNDPARKSEDLVVRGGRAVRLNCGRLVAPCGRDRQAPNVGEIQMDV